MSVEPWRASTTSGNIVEALQFFQLLCLALRKQPTSTVQAEGWFCLGRLAKMLYCSTWSKENEHWNRWQHMKCHKQDLYSFPSKAHRVWAFNCTYKVCIYFVSSLSCCWWKKCGTTWDVYNPVYNGKKLPITWCRISRINHILSNLHSSWDTLSISMSAETLWGHGDAATSIAAAVPWAFCSTCGFQLSRDDAATLGRWDFMVWSEDAES